MEFLEIVTIEKYKGKTYCIIFDNNDRMYWHLSVIDSFSLKEGVKIPTSAMEEIVYQNDLRKARERALYLLEYRDHSYKELFDKLKRNYNEEICLEILQKVVDLGYVNDYEYGKKLGRTLFEVKKVGSRKAKFLMKQKGLSDEIIAEVLEMYDEEKGERLIELIDRKYARYLGDEKGNRKVVNALLRQGYSYDEVKTALKEYSLQDDIAEFDE